MARFYLYCLIGLFAFGQSNAQEIPVGTWRVHLTYHNAHTVAVGLGKVFAASENGLFYWEKADGSLHTLSKIDGLSDIGIAKLAFHEGTQQLVIAYKNGNIDLLGNDGVTNVRTLLNSQETDKRIFDLALAGNSLFLVTAFGGMEFDLQRLVAKDVYKNLGGSTSQGQYLAISSDSLFMRTSNGLFAVSRNVQVNRQDWQQWRSISVNFPIANIATEGQKLYARASDGKIYARVQGVWQLDANFSGNFQKLMQANGRVFALSQGKAVNSDGTSIINLPDELGILQDIAQDGTTYWLADGNSGLVRYENSQVTKLFPTGPFSSQAFRLLSFDKKILAVSGGYRPESMAPYYRTQGFYLFENGQWANYTPEENFIGATAIPSMADWSCATHNVAQKKLYIGTYGHGILVWDLATNAFSTTINTELSPKFITGIATNALGEIWAASNDKGLFVWENGNWLSKLSLQRPTALLLDSENNKWIVQQSGGVWLLGSQGSLRQLRHAKGQGDLRGQSPLSIAQDREGSVWIGTDNGINEFFDTRLALEGGDAGIVYGTSGIPLNQGERITALAVDAGNQKWVGTSNGGVWLYSRQNEPLAHFTTENSPLLSNEIYDIAILPHTGEVFFATPLGIVSYRGTATQAPAKIAEAKIFPNPVRPGFNGLVAIEGLAEDAFVWITDVGGQTVWKGRAAGGSVTWDLRDYSGRKAKSGIYLIFSALADGESALVGQLVVVGGL